MEILDFGPYIKTDSISKQYLPFNIMRTLHAIIVISFDDFWYKVHALNIKSKQESLCSFWNLKSI